MVKEIEDGAFDNCHDIEMFLGHIKWLKYFDKNIIQSIDLDNAKCIKSGTFENYAQLTVAILQDTESIESKAFKNCPCLIRIKLSEKIKSIKPDSFYECSNHLKIKCSDKILKQLETKLVIPNEQEVLSSEMFKDYVNLESIEIPLTTKVDSNFLSFFQNINSVDCDPSLLIESNKKNIKAVFIPNGVKEIKKEYFQCCYELEYIDIPESVEEN